MPGNSSLSVVEVGLVNVMSRETVLRQYVDSVKRDNDYVLLDCCPSLGRQLSGGWLRSRHLQTGSGPAVVAVYFSNGTVTVTDPGGALTLFMAQGKCGAIKGKHRKDCCGKRDGVLYLGHDDRYSKRHKQLPL